MAINMLEAELVDNITQYLRKYQIRNTKEIHMGIGVPDISINIGAPKSMTLLSDYYLLLFVEYLSKNSGVTLCNLSECLSIDKSKAQSYLNQLVAKKIVVQKKDLIYINRKIFGLNLGKTISIEAKIKDWKSGILQAQRYLMFSDYSYLALPNDKIRNVDLEQLNRVGIGLLSVNSIKVEEVVRPQQSQECDYKLKYIVTSSIIKDNMQVVKRKSDGIFSKL